MGSLKELAGHDIIQSVLKPMIEDLATNTARAAMVGDGSELEVAKLRGEYRAYMEILSLFDIEGVDTDE